MGYRGPGRLIALALLFSGAFEMLDECDRSLLSVYCIGVLDKFKKIGTGVQLLGLSLKSCFFCPKLFYLLA